MKHTEIMERVEEIRKRLGGTMAKLGVEASWQECRDGYEVYFRNSEQKIFSPVYIWFASDIKSDAPVASWEDACLCHQKHRKRKLGNTGWWNQRVVDEDVDRITLKGTAMFELIRYKIRSRGTFSGSEDPARLYSDLLADLYWKMSARIPDLAITRVDHEDYPGDKFMVFEALTFLDYQGRRVHITHWPGACVMHLLVDGAEVADFEADHAERAVRYSVRVSKGQSVDGIKLPLR